ncbi:hypothetical protein [Thermococcus stetteri]|uniref:hypothetical protein n=1 Tax=Thermococcus stetteri TaxID=49900 RepID=UPI001FD7527B|nr:hypothetical protein [Thermococcus stetteri]MBP1910852.1 hypothetical protein [Thermococcus stetteri]
MVMEERWEKIAEYIVEAALIAWLGYLFLYQNYLLYHWHRGLPLPSRTPYAILGLIMGGAFLALELWRNRTLFLEKNVSTGMQGQGEDQ